MSYEEEHINNLKEECNLIIKKMGKISKALILETDTSVQFKLEHEKEELEKKLEALKTEITQARTVNVSAGLTATKKGAMLHDYHRFTCNRDDQYDQFEIFSGKQKDKKVQYYYLYGAEPQSHKGMFKRLAYDREGRLRDYINPDLELHCQAKKVEITFETSSYPEVYKSKVLKNLLTAFSVNVNDQEPLLEKNLNDLLDASPTLQSLGENDYVFILLRISEWDWNPKVTPLVVKWLIESFFEVELPPTAPTFMIFFGLIYEEDDSGIEFEVLEIIKEGQYLQILPELEMVSKGHVKRWFSKYDMLYQSTQQKKDLLNQHFGKGREFEMEEVENSLHQIIDRHNKKRNRTT